MSRRKAVDLDSLPDRLIGPAEVAAMYGISKAYVFELVATGRIPKQVTMFKGKWLLSDILAHIRSLKQDESDEAKQ